MLDGRKKCLETRRTDDGFIRRRLLMDDGSLMWTVEIPEAIFKGLESFVRHRANKHRNNLAIQSEAEKRRRLVLSMVEEGVKREAIAVAAKCSLARVYQIVNEQKNGAKDGRKSSRIVRGCREAVSEPACDGE